MLIPSFPSLCLSHFLFLSLLPFLSFYVPKGIKGSENPSFCEIFLNWKKEEKYSIWKGSTLFNNYKTIIERLRCKASYKLQLQTQLFGNNCMLVVQGHQKLLVLLPTDPGEAGPVASFAKVGCPSLWRRA